MDFTRPEDSHIGLNPLLSDCWLAKSLEVLQVYNQICDCKPQTWYVYTITWLSQLDSLGTRLLILPESKHISYKHIEPGIQWFWTWKLQHGACSYITAQMGCGLFAPVCRIFAFKLASIKSYWLTVWKLPIHLSGFIHHNVIMAAKQCASTFDRDKPGHLPNCLTDHCNRSHPCFGLFCTDRFRCAHQATGRGASWVRSNPIFWGFLQRVQSEGRLEELLNCIDSGKMIGLSLSSQQLYNWGHSILVQKVGCTTLATTVLGCCGQNPESACTLLTYSVLLLVIAVLQVKPSLNIIWLVILLMTVLCLCQSFAGHGCPYPD